MTRKTRRRRDGFLMLRVLPSERRELDAAAHLEGIPTSTWLRNLGLSTARRALVCKRFREGAL